MALRVSGGSMKRKPLIMNMPEETHVHLSMMTRNTYAVGMASTSSRKYRRWIERRNKRGDSCEFDLTPELVVKR
jgi:hypothetical protein